MREGGEEGGMGEKSYHAHSRCPAARLLLQDPDYPSVGLGAARLLQGQQVRPAMDQGGQCTSSKPRRGALLTWGSPAEVGTGKPGGRPGDSHHSR